jgi:hypothetical protein
MRLLSQLRDLRLRHLGKLRELNSRPSYQRSGVYHQFHEVQPKGRLVRQLLKIDQHNSCIDCCMSQLFL